MKVVDLFAGLGGFSTAAAQAGLHVVFAANHWQLAVTVHGQNHPDIPVAPMKLMTDTDWSRIPKMDLLLASPACQGHSTAASRHGVGGKRANMPKHDDDRVTALAVTECVNRHKPSAVIVENVREFMEWDLYPWWKEGFERMGYAISENVLNAADAGVPQDRERLFIVAVRGKKPLVVKPPTLKHVGIECCLDLDLGDWESVSGKTENIKARIRRALANKQITGHDVFLSQHVTNHPGRSVKRPVGTITTKAQWNIVKREGRGHVMRPFSVNEYRRAMGFPEGYLLPVNVVNSVRLLGNAVCPPLAKYVIERVVRSA